jgi:hypothetical protein
MMIPPCDICGDRRDCAACRARPGSRWAELLATDPRYRDHARAMYDRAARMQSDGTARRLAAIIACPDRISDCHCLDKVASCLKHGKDVRLADCLDCPVSRPGETGADAPLTRRPAAD